jgi:hypothetical protein
MKFLLTIAVEKVALFIGNKRSMSTQCTLLFSCANCSANVAKRRGTQNFWCGSGQFYPDLNPRPDLTCKIIQMYILIRFQPGPDLGPDLDLYKYKFIVKLRHGPENLNTLYCTVM